MKESLHNNQIIPAFRDYLLYEKNLSNITVRNYLSDINRFLQYLQKIPTYKNIKHIFDRNFDFAQIDDYLYSLKKNPDLTANSQKRYISTLHLFQDWLKTQSVNLTTKNPIITEERNSSESFHKSLKIMKLVATFSFLTALIVILVSIGIVFFLVNIINKNENGYITSSNILGIKNVRSNLNLIKEQQNIYDTQIDNGSQMVHTYYYFDPKIEKYYIISEYDQNPYANTNNQILDIK